MEINFDNNNKMSATHLNQTSNHPSYAQSTDFLNLDEPPAAKESPSGSQFCLADDNGNGGISNGSYTHNYQQNLRQARLLNADDTIARPPIGEPVRRRSTNYIDALQDKAKAKGPSEIKKQDFEQQSGSEGESPVFKPSYTTAEKEQIGSGQGDFEEEGQAPPIYRRKSSFAYEDFKKDVYDRLNMFRGK